MKMSTNFKNANVDGTVIQGMNVDGTWSDPNMDPSMMTGMMGPDGMPMTGATGTNGFDGTTMDPSMMGPGMTGPPGMGGSATTGIPIPRPVEEGATPATPVAPEATPWKYDADWTAYKAKKDAFDAAAPIWMAKQMKYFDLSTRKADADNEAWEKQERDLRIVADTAAAATVSSAKEIWTTAKSAWDTKKAE